MLTNEDWFTLDIDPKYIVNEFNSSVRSQMIYAAELLTYKPRQPFIEEDCRVVNLFITKLFKLRKERPINHKHQLRTQLALRIEKFEMTVDKIVQGRVETWLARRSIQNKDIANRDNQSLLEILELKRDHPLRFALEKLKPASVPWKTDTKNRKMPRCEAKNSRLTVACVEHGVEKGGRHQ